MTRASLEMKTTVATHASGPKLESASTAGPLFNLYSALVNLQIADKGRFADRKSYHNRRWWDENYKPALLAIEEAVKVVAEDDYSLRRLLMYIHGYCRALSLMLVSQRNGHCQLCDEYTALAASHIVPHFFLRKVPKPMCFHHRNLCALQDDVKKYALCGLKSKKQLNCEALFGEWEMKFSKVYADLQSKGSDPYAFEYKEWLPLFAYSVAWRLLLLANANVKSEDYQHPDWYNNVKVVLASFLEHPLEGYKYPVDTLELPWMFMVKFEDIPVHLGGPLINHTVHLACGGPTLEHVGKTDFLFVHLMEILFLFPVTEEPAAPAVWEPFRLGTSGTMHSISYAELPNEIKYFLKETYDREVVASYAGTNLTVKPKSSSSVHEAVKKWVNRPPFWILAPCIVQFNFLEQQFTVYPPFSVCNEVTLLGSDEVSCALQLCKEGDKFILLMAYTEKQEPFSTVLLALLLPIPNEKWCIATLQLYPSRHLAEYETVKKEVAEFMSTEFTLGSQLDKILASWQSLNASKV